MSTPIWATTLIGEGLATICELSGDWGPIDGSLGDLEPLVFMTLSIDCAVCDMAEFPPMDLLKASPLLEWDKEEALLIIWPDLSYSSTISRSSISLSLSGSKNSDLWILLSIKSSSGTRVLNTLCLSSTSSPKDFGGRRVILAWFKAISYSLNIVNILFSHLLTKEVFSFDGFLRCNGNTIKRSQLRQFISNLLFKWVCVIFNKKY